MEIETSSALKHTKEFNLMSKCFPGVSVNERGRSFTGETHLRWRPVGSTPACHSYIHLMRSGQIVGKLRKEHTDKRILSNKLDINSGVLKSR